MPRKKKNQHRNMVPNEVEIDTTETEVEEAPVEVAEVEEAPVAVEEEVVEEVVVEEAPVVEEVAPAAVDPVKKSAKPAHQLNAWWNEVGSRLVNRGYGNGGVVKRAISAFGPEFNKEAYTSYCSNNRASNVEEMVKAVWNSQK